MVKVYYDKDADLGVLKNKTVAIIGYGSQGHAQAQNLRDSGIKVIVAELEGTDNYNLAVEHGFKPISAEEAARNVAPLTVSLVNSRREIALLFLSIAFSPSDRFNRKEFLAACRELVHFCTRCGRNSIVRIERNFSF